MDPVSLSFAQDNQHTPKTPPNEYPNTPTSINNAKLYPKPFLIRDIFFIKGSSENSTAAQNHIPFILFQYANYFVYLIPKVRLQPIRLDGFQKKTLRTPRYTIGNDKSIHLFSKSIQNHCILFEQLVLNLNKPNTSIGFGGINILT